jgi:hypothetical protein
MRRPAHSQILRHDLVFQVKTVQFSQVDRAIPRWQRVPALFLLQLIDLFVLVLKLESNQVVVLSAEADLVVLVCFELDRAGRFLVYKLTIVLQKNEGAAGRSFLPDLIDGPTFAVGVLNCAVLGIDVIGVQQVIFICV